MPGAFDDETACRDRAAEKRGDGPERGRIRMAAGLMSGTAMDGVDAALLETDGRQVVRPLAWLTTAYDPPVRERLARLVAASAGGRAVPAGEEAEAARLLTDAHAAAVEALLEASRLPAARIDVVGFPGHTILHRPERRLTRQIGDAERLAERLRLPVVGDFRSADVAAGGQGAPLAPLYHAALAGRLPGPVAMLNIGGVANVTLVDSAGGGAAPALLAFDTGPGNALIDDWVARHAGRAFDEGGALARAGTVDAGRLAALLDHPYFERPPPKSLDRQDFAALAESVLEGLGAADGAATLTAFTVAAVARAVRHLPTPPRRWLVCGGGRRNDRLMATLAEALAAPVTPVESAGWDGDALEAQAFAYLAVRTLDGLPLSLPETTGVPRPMPGGVLHRPAGGRAA